MSMEQGFSYIYEWVERTFPDQDTDGARSKFTEELVEFIVDGDDQELVDIFITLITLAKKLYGNLGAFESAVSEKMRVNMHEREWDVDENGCGQHRKGEDAD